MPVIKCFSKGQIVSILNFLHVYLRLFWIVSVDTHVPEIVPRCYTKRVCCTKCHPSWCDMNETFLQWRNCCFFCLSDLGRFPANFVCTNRFISRWAIVLWTLKWKATLLMLKPASAMPITQMRSSLVGFCDFTYQNFITFLLLVDVCFPVTL